MDWQKPPSRERTYYDDYPDYTRPALEIPLSFRKRVFGRLEFLYGTEAAENWMPELERILKVHNAHKIPIFFPSGPGICTLPRTRRPF